MYVDFEALLEKVQNNRGVYTLAFQKHSAKSYALYVKVLNNVSIDLNNFQFYTMAASQGKKSPNIL